MLIINVPMPVTHILSKREFILFLLALTSDIKNVPSSLTTDYVMMRQPKKGFTLVRVRLQEHRKSSNISVIISEPIRLGAAN